MHIHNVCLCDECASEIHANDYYVSVTIAKKGTSYVDSKMATLKMDILLSHFSTYTKKNINYLAFLEQEQMHFCKNCCNDLSRIHLFQYETFLSRLAVLESYFDVKNVETLSLDPQVASIVEIAYTTDIKGERDEVQSFNVQPVLHMEDNLYGGTCINDFVSTYNKKFKSAHDPDCLCVFAPEDTPLFFYAQTALTFNVEPPKIKNPMDWLIGDRLTARQALMNLDAYISKVPSSTRWILAGHNIQYDFNVLTYWSRRVLGDADAHVFLNKFNKFKFLDTLALVRWLQYSGTLLTEKATLSSVAHELGLSTANLHSAKEDLKVCLHLADLFCVNNF